MKLQTFYYFNPETLTFEKKQFSVKDIVKRGAWFLATALAFSVIIIWISFYLIDSPKELMLRQENEELKEKVVQLEREKADLCQRLEELCKTSTPTGTIAIYNPTINGPLYGISDNDIVNLGGLANG